MSPISNPCRFHCASARHARHAPKNTHPQRMISEPPAGRGLNLFVLRTERWSASLCRAWIRLRPQPGRGLWPQARPRAVRACHENGCGRRNPHPPQCLARISARPVQAACEFRQCRSRQSQLMPPILKLLPLLWKPHPNFSCLGPPLYASWPASRQARAWSALVVTGSGTHEDCRNAPASGRSAYIPLLARGSRQVLPASNAS